MAPLWRPAGFVYLRLHEGAAHPWPAYGTRALRTWARRVGAAAEDGADAYVYFNNDPGGAAVRNARTYQALAARVGAANTNYLGEAELRRKISARAELTESEVAELELCLERRQPPPIHRTNFENRLFAEDGPPILRIPSSRSPDRIPPWRRSLHRA